jgi:integral membrane protein (TIGR01906 family)
LLKTRNAAVTDRKNALKGLSALLGMLLLVPALLLLAFEWSVLDRGFHQQLYNELGSARAAGVDEGTLSQIGDMLMDYLNGARGDLTMTATVNGAVQPVFNEREIAHMADVKGLFDLERRVKAVFAGLGLALLAAGLIGPGWAKRLKRAGLTGQIFWLALIAFAAIWAAIDFDGLFRRFHGILFTNDLWLLNPQTDLMIRMLPEQFFAMVAARAAVWMLACQALLFALWALPVAAARRMNRKENP